MPSSSVFATDFTMRQRKLQKISKDLGLQIKIKKVEVSHVLIEEYKIYEFPIIIKVEGPEKDLNIFISHLNKTIGIHKSILYSQYGNPYECSIKEKFKLSSNNNIISSLGHAFRIANKAT